MLQKPYQKINTRPVSLVRYSGPFLKGTRKEVKQMVERTRKLMTIQKVLHPRDNFDRLYVQESREEEDLPDSVDASIQRLEGYIEKNEERLITAIRNDTDHTMANKTTITRKQK